MWALHGTFFILEILPLPDSIPSLYYCCDRRADKKHCQKGLALAHSLRGHSPSWQGRHGSKSGHIPCSIRRQREVKAGIQRALSSFDECLHPLTFSFSFSPRLQPLARCSFKVSLSYPVKLFWKHLRWHTDRCVSLVALNVKLLINISQHARMHQQSLEIEDWKDWSALCTRAPQITPQSTSLPTPACFHPHLEGEGWQKRDTSTIEKESFLFLCTT